VVQAQRLVNARKAQRLELDLGAASVLDLKIGGRMGEKSDRSVM
jgi:hypothetical protein